MIMGLGGQPARDEGRGAPVQPLNADSDGRAPGAVTGPSHRGLTGRRQPSCSASSPIRPSVVGPLT